MKAPVVTMMTSDRTLLVAAIAATATILVAILSALAAHLANKRERRRLLYSKAVRAAVAWKEMLYRLRRRQPGQERELIDRFHNLQDRLSYYQAWVGSESSYMNRSYGKFVAGVKRATEPLILQAWKQSPRPPPSHPQTDDQHPDLSSITDSFLKDVRSHLSPWPWRKLSARWRNRTSKTTS